jgi:hypothetical protein
MRKLLKYLDHAGWILAFVVLCLVFGNQVLRGTKHAALPPDKGAWICPILGVCGPPGTPGLGRW